MKKSPPTNSKRHRELETFLDRVHRNNKVDTGNGQFTWRIVAQSFQVASCFPLKSTNILGPGLSALIAVRTSRFCKFLFLPQKLWLEA